MTPAKFKHKVKKRNSLSYSLNYSLLGAVIAQHIELKMADST